MGGQKLREIMVDPLPPGSSFFVSHLAIGNVIVTESTQSVFDACHSGTLLGKCSMRRLYWEKTDTPSLDLTHYRCNRVYVPWVSKRKIPRVHRVYNLVF